MSIPHTLSAPHGMPHQFGRSFGGRSLGAIPRHAQTPRTATSPFAGHTPGHRSLAQPGANVVRQRDRIGRIGEPQGQPGRLGQRPAGHRLAGNRAAWAPVLRNPSFAHRSHVAAATFHGHFHDWKWRGHRRHFITPIVIGWAGPLYWPYAYDDFVDYTFYPYAYDTFWPYAYDDVYEGLIGTYADGAGGGSTGSSSGGTRTATRRAPAARGGGTTANLCSGSIAGLTDPAIARIAQAVEPDDTQRAALDAFKDTAAKALEQLQASCPNALPSTPTGRLAAMHQRLDAMLQTVRTVRPALEAFYQSLNDEQKARFNALSDDNGDQQAQQRDLSQACGERASGIAGLPIERIETAVRPDDTQKTALQDLQAATAQAVEQLKSDCPTYRALTPVVRLQSMEQRLDAMLRAVQTVEPALEKFYGALSDEQKERFNRLTPRQA